MSTLFIILWCWFMLTVSTWAKPSESTTTYSTQFCSTKYGPTPTKPVPRSTTVTITHSHVTVGGTVTVTSTVSPNTVTVTSKSFITSTVSSATTLPVLTQTTTTTTTSTSTSVTTYTNGLVATTTTTTTSTITGPDSTVTAPPGFTPIGEMYPEEKRVKKRDVSPRDPGAALPFNAKRDLMLAGAKVYPTHVDCTQTKTIVTVTYSAVTSKTTVTTGSTPTTTLTTTSSTITTATYISTPPNATTTATSSITAYITSTTIVTTITSTSTFTSTATSFAPGQTIYQVCADPNNYIDTYQSYIIDRVAEMYGYDTMDVSSAEECCIACAQSSTCGASFFYEMGALGDNCVFAEHGDSCDPTVMDDYFYGDMVSDGIQIKISNGACGRSAPGFIWRR